MEIERIEKIPVEYHIEKEGWSRNVESKKYDFWPATLPGVIIKLHVSGGLCGVGEAVTQYWYLGSTLEHVYRALSMFEVALKGKDPRNLEKIHKIMESNLGRGAPGVQPAKDGLNMALYDVLGKHYGEPAYNLLGGAHQTSFQLMTNLYLGTPETMAKRAKEYADRGYSLKIKCGMDIEEKGWSLATAKKDVRKLTLTLETVPDTIYVDADSNQSWGTAKRTITIVKSNNLEKYSNLAIEQPVQYADLEGASRIAAAISLPVVLDESIYSPEVLIEAIRKNAADRIVIKPTRVGGLYTTRKMISIAEAAGVNVSIDSTPFSKIGDTAVCHVAATIREPYPLDVETHTWLKENSVKSGGLVLDGDIAKIDSKPGLGIELNEDVIESIRLKNIDGIFR